MSDANRKRPSKERGFSEHAEDDCMSTAAMTDADETDSVVGKKPKLGSPGVMRRVSSRVDCCSDGNISDVPKRNKMKKMSKSSASVAAVASASSSKVSGRGEKSVSEDGFLEVKQITEELLKLLADGSVSNEIMLGAYKAVSKYEFLCHGLIVQNARLKEKCKVGPSAVPAVSLPVTPAVSAPPVVDMVKPLIRKPVETWSVVVRGKKGVTSRDVVKKVVDEVAPTLGVRVHEVRPTRDGGAVIRTPSVAERKKVAGNGKFAELGLEVSVNDKLGPKIIVQNVESHITSAEFMEDLYSMNLKDRMSLEVFKKSVRVVGDPWKADGKGQISVVLECTSIVAEHLLSTGVYIKWFRFRVRMRETVFACYRCLSFDHRVQECRVKDEICRRCGVSGHRANRCSNELRCRNCAARGMPSGHLMMSVVCPIYSARVARLDARH